VLGEVVMTSEYETGSIRWVLVLRVYTAGTLINAVAMLHRRDA
jgi:hypothetical protein